MSHKGDFARRLLDWWDRHGRHDLPWQQQRNVYRVWLAEIMLQQTQVSTVMPYYQRFLGRFPDVDTLAAAAETEVLALWSGLGYYARARNLHRAARQVVEQHQGEFPHDPAALEQLPGIGRSTANAIVSQTWDEPLPILDGNAKRVLARHAAVAGWPGRAAVNRRLWQEAERRLPTARGADYTQAIMDLGATLCRRSRPDCRQCPVSADCQARLDDAIDQYPGRKAGPERPQRQTHMLLLRDRQGRLLLQRRPPSGIWGGLWCPPENEDLERLQGQLGAPGKTMAGTTLEHGFTHFRLTIHPHHLRCEADRIGVESGDRLDWRTPAEWLTEGLPQPVRRLLEQMTDSKEDA